VYLAFPSRRGLLKIRSRPKIILMRAFVGTLNILLVFGAFSLLPMANATSLIFTSALFMPVLGIIFLGEKVGIYRASAILVGFIGVLIVAQPGASDGWNLLGVGLGLGAAIIAGTLGIMLRVLGQSEAPETVTFYFLQLGMLFLLPAMPFVATLPAWDEVPFIMGLGVSGFLMQITLTIAFKYAQAAIVAPCNYTQIVWATLLGWIVFSTIPSLHIMIGSAIIVVSSLIVFLRERYLARKGRLKLASI
jgi:drug/metabolite transporter (DMT)-like permease